MNIVRARWMPRDLMRASESPGKPRRQARGSWIDDLAALRKAITLCFKCSRKFNADGYHKVAVAGYMFVWATCDGCRSVHTRCALFKHGDRK